LPFIGLSLLARGELFLRQQHARSVAQVLAALEHGQPERIIFSYPPLSFLLALLYPSTLTLNLAAALLVGAAAWVLWGALRPLGLGTRIALLAAWVATSASAFLATQDVGQAATSFCFVLAWRGLLDWLQRERVWGGFVAGMLLGLAFYAGLYALACGVLAALATPWASSGLQAATPKERRQALLARVIVVAFPVVMAFASWSYLNLINSGDPWLFLKDSTAAGPGAPPVTGLLAALRDTGYELLRLPLYMLVGLAIALKARGKLPLYLAPLASVILLRALGVYYPEALALSACTAAALVALSQWRARRWRALWVMVALLQIGLSLALPSRDGDLARWRALLERRGSLATGKAEVVIAAQHAEYILVATSEADPAARLAVLALDRWALEDT